MTDLNINDCINERREKSESHTKPSEAFRRYFGPDHGVELPLQERYGYRPLKFPEFLQKAIKGKKNRFYCILM